MAISGKRLRSYPIAASLHFSTLSIGMRRTALDKAAGARQTLQMFFVRPAWWIAASLALMSAPVAAASAPPDTVDCAYQALSDEDRELAMLLLFVRYGDSDAERVLWLRGMVVAERLLGAARTQCRMAHGWTRAQASLSRDFAFDSLVIEAARQTLQAEGDHLAAPIDDWFGAHGLALERMPEPDSDQGKAFTAYLVEQGWDSEGEADLKLARKYLEALIKRSADSRRFAAASRSETSAVPASRDRP